MRKDMGLKKENKSVRLNKIDYSEPYSSLRERK